MQNQATLSLILRKKEFKIPSNFRYIHDIDPDIYETLKLSQKYEVKSNVNEEIFQSFINYWLNKEIPDFSEKNISSFEELSNEFDLMKDIIQIYKKYDSQIYSMTNTNQYLINQESIFIKGKIEADIFQREKENRYQQIFDALLNNDAIQSNNYLLYNFKSTIFEYFRSKNPKLIDIYTRQQCRYNKLLYALNDKDETAGVLFDLMETNSFTIPQYIFFNLKKYEVTSIYESAFTNRNISSFVFEPFSNVQLIDEKAFSQSTIKSISIPKHVKKIGKGAFEGCFHLQSVSFPKDSELETIEHDAFGCSAISNLTIPSKFIDFKEGWCHDTLNLNNINILSSDNPSIISLDKLIIQKSSPESEIYDVIIFASRDIETATIPSFVKRIAPFAFDECIKLKKIEFAEDSQLDSIDYCAFHNSSLSFISVPPSTTKIAKKAFSFCKKLNRIEFTSDSHLISIGEKAFEGSFIESIVIPSSIKEFKKCWCKQTPYLDQIEILQNNEQNIISLNDDQFILGKSDLNSDIYDVLLFAKRDIQKAVIPSYIKIIGSAAFNDCYQIDQIEFENDSKLQLIDKYAFANSSLPMILIPPQVIAMEKKSFSDCYNLKKIDFTDNSALLKFGDRCLNFSSIESLSIPSKVNEFVLQWCGETRKLVNIRISPKNEKFSYFEEKYIIGKSDLKSMIYDVLVFARRDIKIGIIPSFIKIISPYAFSSNILKVHFASNSELEIIDEYSFAFSYLTEIEIPSNVTRLGEGAFFDCMNLKKLKFQENSHLQIIEGNSLTNTKIKSLVIPPHVSIIERMSFSGSPIEIIEISENSELDSLCSDMFELVPEIIMVPVKLRGWFKLNIF